MMQLATSDITVYFYCSLVRALEEQSHRVCATSLLYCFFQNDMSLLSVDGYSMDGVSHKEAVTIIRRSYMDKKNPILKMVLLNN